MRIFSKTTNDVGVLKQRLVSTSNTSVTALHSLQKESNTFRNELFNAILAERTFCTCATKQSKKNKVQQSNYSYRKCIAIDKIFFSFRKLGMPDGMTVSERRLEAHK